MAPGKAMLVAMTHCVSADLAMRLISEAKGNHRVLENAIKVPWNFFQINPAPKPGPEGQGPALRPPPQVQQA